MYDNITYYIRILELYYLIIIPLEEPMAVVVVAVAVVAAVAVAAAVVVAVAVAVTVAVDAGVDQSRTHAHSSLAHSFIGVSLMSPGTWSAISSATLVSVAQIELVFFPDCPTLDPSANFPWETKTIRLPWKVCRRIGRGTVGKEDQVDLGNAYQGRR